jgi:succinyl-CoA synthetase alpha subunit
MALKTEVMVSFYQDSVVLMRVASQVRKKPGVREVALFMGTPANQTLLSQIGLATKEAQGAGPNDLIITVDGADEVAADAIAAVKELLTQCRRSREESREFRPRTLDSALHALPDANLVSISIPGPYVKAEAMAALRRNLHCFIFSDNVPLADEIALKKEALERRLFCMGPDQGTAYLGGIGLGFANVVGRGRIGCVAASGTGLQAVVSRLASLGEGVSQAIGVGGRDLSEAVGGRMTFFALESLEMDPATEAVILISKPPHPSVLGTLKAKLGAMEKPVVVCCVGAAPATVGRTVWVETLDRAADAAVAFLAGRAWEPGTFCDRSLVERRLAELGDRFPFRGKEILGLYTGGTLAYETRHLFREPLGEKGPYRILDLGDDEYTIGRPHPMIDPRVRTEMILEAGACPEVGVVLLDLVLGTGSHENPAEPLAAAVKEARRAAQGQGRELAFLASIVGTARDPQDLASQCAQLEEAGIAVFAVNADAARVAALLVKPEWHEKWMGRRA